MKAINDRQSQNSASSQPTADRSTATGEPAFIKSSKATREERRRASKSARDQTTSMSISEYDKIRCECLRNVFYHEDRAGFLLGLDRWLRVLSVVGLVAWPISSANQAQMSAIVPISVGFILIGVYTAMTDLSKLGTHHDSMRGEFLRIYNELDPADTSTAAHQLKRTYTSETGPTYRLVDAVAYNRAMASIGRPRERYIELTNWKRLLRHFWTASSMEFFSLDELRREV